jgi:hypothetical protein
MILDVRTKSTTSVLVTERKEFSRKRDLRARYIPGHVLLSVVGEDFEAEWSSNGDMGT